ncbi:hypothetical protein F2Q69_00037365 [Brassica cretica]|uniref:Glutaminyl-tRNA synthetase class Ib non-specific RNA-binding domain-containing protein n=1 Tax=Brassica cretica TaxID=69181 RepID=A0A8S9SUE0_BRACR|nr:hypothetical protein F2Q69_00037365 [Brassica cretica]
MAPTVTANLTAVIHEIKTLAQLDAAVLFFDNHAPEDFKLNEFEESRGVGVEVSA